MWTKSGVRGSWGRQRGSAGLREGRDRDHLRARALRGLLGLEEAPEDRTRGAALGVEPVRDAGVAVGDDDPIAPALAELHLAAVQRDAAVAVVVAHHPAIPEHDVREGAA